MAINKAKKFLNELLNDEELQKKFSGFTLDELKKAAAEMKKSGELSDDDLDKIAGGSISINIDI
jgi:hypothetical protein